MKIGDVVSYAAGLDRHPECGKLMRIEQSRGARGGHGLEMIAVILALDRNNTEQLVRRDLKRVKTVVAGRKHLAANRKRDAKRKKYQMSLCDICTTGTPNDSRPWFRENCPKCRGTGRKPNDPQKPRPAG